MFKKNKLLKKAEKAGKSFFGDFKSFISRGNVLDLAVAVVISTAFGKITTALVNNIIMPLVSLLPGGVDVTDWKWVITPAKEAVVGADGTILIPAKAEAAVGYGLFIQAIINFLIIALSIFIFLRILRRMEARLHAKETALAEAKAAEEKEKAEQAAAEAKAAAEAAARRAAELAALDESYKRAVLRLCEQIKTGGETEK